MVKKTYLFCLIILFVIKTVLADLTEDDVLIMPSIVDPDNKYSEPDYSVGERIANANSDTDSQNPESMGPYFEGDIMIDKSNGRNGIINTVYRWPAGVIPIFVNTTWIDSTTSNFILSQMTYLHQRTCLRFVYYATWHVNWIEITGDTSGCWSYIGNQNKGRQYLNLSPPGCTTKIGTVIHELIHASGFFHEQSRTDRDSYVRINLTNVQADKVSNFNKYDATYITPYGIPYNYSSVMHYDTKAFSMNGLPTIVPIYSAPNMGQRDYAADSDIKKINIMYNCTTTTLPPPTRDEPIQLQDLYDGRSIKNVRMSRANIKKYLKKLEAKALKDEPKGERLADINYLLKTL